ncbi:MAG: aldehyde dehydrogenase, partial [Nanoarchaeota archaeon]|nr:aldehyde dehydrogenase [Nanoarchaeota archaeon]
DTVYGPFKGKVTRDKENIVIDGRKIKVISERDINKLPWKKLGVDVVIESTGVFRDRESASVHLRNGAKYVLITAPAKNPDITIVPGVNHEKLKKEHKIISVASCTTNCLTPIVKVLHDKFKIKRALMTTVHAYTNDQSIHDEFHKKPRRGRAGALNMIPTTTGAAESVIEVMPDLLGKINGLAVRVPVACGSLVDIVAELSDEPTVKKVNDEFKNAAKGKMKGIIEYSEDELVSSDIISNPNSAIVDSLCTQTDGNLVKVLAWYDNEWGYSNRVIDVIKMLT